MENFMAILKMWSSKENIIAELASHSSKSDADPGDGILKKFSYTMSILQELRERIIIYLKIKTINVSKTEKCAAIF